MNKRLKHGFSGPVAGLGAAVSILVISVLSSAAVFAQSAPGADALELAAITQPIFAAIGTVFAGVLAIYVPRALAVLQARTKIQLTEQQRATVLGAVRTAAGLIETNLDQGVMPMAHVDVVNPVVRAEAVNAINAVPTAAAALNMTVDGMARMIVGAVDTGAHGNTNDVARTAVVSATSR